VSDSSARARGGTIVMVSVAGASFGHGVVEMGAGSAPVMRLWDTGRSKLPSPLEIM
jgi:hypothetical protein